MIPSADLDRLEIEVAVPRTGSRVVREPGGCKNERLVFGVQHGPAPDVFVVDWLGEAVDGADPVVTAARPGGPPLL